MWVRLSRRFRDGRALRRRIERRARTLALLERQRVQEAMVSDLILGHLDEQLIEIWEPARGGTGPCEACKAGLRLCD
jgi:hypothetical protein